MHYPIYRFLPAIGLLVCRLGAQGLTPTNGSIVDPALGTRVRIEAVRASANGPAAVLITVFRPARPVTIRLAIPQVRLLMNLSDSVLALPIGPEQSTSFPIYLSPLAVGPTLTTTRLVTEQGDVMQIHVNTASTSATALLGRKAAEAFIVVLGSAIAEAASVKDSGGSAHKGP
jgi:hypothetical protein